MGLSQSKYGKYGNLSYTGAERQVRINNCSSYITGVGADSQDASPSSSTCTSNTYTTTKGQAASTTGNITGVYDMSGGTSEYVMGLYNKKVGSGGINFSNINEKYYDNYTGTTATTACNGGICYGHALSETSEWYNAYAYFTNSTYPWFRRGGSWGDGNRASVFISDYLNGEAFDSTFRVILLDTSI